MDLPKQEKTLPDKASRELDADKTSDDLQEGIWEDEQVPTSLNDDLAEKIKDDPNKFIGCGG